MKNEFRCFVTFFALFKNFFLLEINFLNYQFWTFQPINIECQHSTPSATEPPATSWWQHVQRIIYISKTSRANDVACALWENLTNDIIRSLTTDVRSMSSLIVRVVSNLHANAGTALLMMTTLCSRDHIAHPIIQLSSSRCLPPSRPPPPPPPTRLIMSSLPEMSSSFVFSPTVFCCSSWTA